MSNLRHNSPQRLDLHDAAEYLGVRAHAVEDLVQAGYLRAVDGEAGPEFALTDLKAFVARNDDNGAGNVVLDEPDAADPQALLDALDGRSDEMARRAFEIFASVFQDARTWPLNEQARFIDQARNRFEAILAVTGQGSAVDEALVGDLQEVGAAAAWSGSPLPQLLVILRISRDLVVQTAVELADERGHHWGLALSLLLTRILPAMDRLTDALAQGYWAAMAGREEEQRSRYEHVVETSSNGVYEVDLDGRLQYANPSLGIILGRPLEDLDGAPLSEVVRPADPAVSVEGLMGERPAVDGQCLEMSIIRSDGVRRVLEIRTSARYRFEELVGFQGVVRDVTTAYDLEADKNDFVALVTQDLRQPLATLLGQGANLEANAAELLPHQVGRIGESIRRQVERIARLADDLSDATRMGSLHLGLSTRPVDLAQVVSTALASVRRPGDVEVRIPSGVEVLADPRRLEQVVGNLVDNGLEHGRAPVVVELAGAAAGMVEFTVTDEGDGVPAAAVPTLFAGLRERARVEGERRHGVGLALAKGLIEAMGGRVAYEAAPGAGARFRVAVPVPNRRPAER